MSSKVISQGILFFSLFILVVFPLSSRANGPSNVNTDGTPRKQGTVPIHFSLDSGPLQDTQSSNCDFDALCGGGSGGMGGCSLSHIPLLRNAEAAISSNAEGVAAFNDAAATWGAIPESTVSFQFDGTLSGGDITACNVDDLFPVFRSNNYAPDANTDPRICGCINPKPAGCTATSCVNPIVFDTTGDIIAFLGGEGNRFVTYGSTLSESVPGQNNYVRFNMIINTACLEDSPATSNACGVGGAGPGCAFNMTTQQIKGVILHEMGHAAGLVHSQANANCINSFPTGDEVKPGCNAEVIPTMFPSVVINADQTTLTRDDAMSMAHIYPEPGLASGFCKAEGVVIKGGQPLRCASVSLINIADPTDVIEAFSGAEITNNGQYNSPGYCTEANPINCARYKVDGLKPGATYKVEVNPMAASLAVPYCNPVPPAYPTFTSPGNVTCPAAGTSMVCSGGVVNDTDLCPNLP